MASIEKTNDFLFNVARGMVSNVSSINKFGRNSNINISTQDLWSVGGTWVQPTAARVHNIASTNANDAAAGTGAQTVLISGLDANYAVASETVTLNGLTPVATVNSYIMINSFYVVTVGIDGQNDGIISATAAVDLTVTSQIAAGMGRSLQAIYQTPAGYTSFLLDVFGSAQCSSTANPIIELMVKPFGGMWLSTYILNINSSANNFESYRYPIPVQLAAKSLVKLRCNSSANNTDASGGFSIVSLQQGV